MINLIKKNFLPLLKNSFSFLFAIQSIIMYCYLYNKFFFLIKSIHLKLKNSHTFLSTSLLNFNFLINDLSNLEGLFLNRVLLSVEHIKIQELTFLPEYFLITSLFCITLFALFSLKIVVNEKDFLIKFQYNNQLIFLLIFVLICYLILIYQQMNFSLLALTSFNDTIHNDQLAFISKLAIGVSSILYLIFITQYLQNQKLSNFEYYIILLTSIFGFFLLCGANDLITSYLSIELQGLAFYVLASFKKSSNFSIESGVKYFVLGSLSTVLFLLGTTFIYGLTGSLVLTDFKDLFIWIFCPTSSFFLSLESIDKALEVFQEKTSVAGTPEVLKLQIILDKLNLLKKKIYSLSFEIELYKPLFNGFVFEANSLNKIKLYSRISEKLIELYSQIDLTLFIGYQNYLGFVVDKNFLQACIFVWSVNGFLIEGIFENALIEFLYVFQKNQLNYNSFISFKNDLFKANYYENLNLDEFSSISIESLDFKDEFAKFSRIKSDLEGDTHLNSTYNLLGCCYFSEYVFNTLNFIEFSNNKVQAVIELNLLGISTKFYEFSVMNLINLNNLLLIPFEVNSIEQLFMFDFSFVLIGVLFIVIALFFKLALAPFHLWAPDVYEGSPSSSTFFFMVISKFSIFVFLLRICYFSFYSLISYWQFYSLIIATLSVFVGAIAGLKQRRLKSLMTYSSINNMGFVLLAFSVGNFEGVQVKFYYLIVYMLASICFWSIILNIRLKKKINTEKQNKDLGDLAVLQESNSMIAQNLSISLFSLAGLPPTVGFLAKIGVFKALVGVSMYFFSVINVLFSVIATFYYLRIIKIIFFENFLIGNLYETISLKTTFIINLLSFTLIFLFTNPMFLYLYSYKVTLFLNKTFY